MGKGRFMPKLTQAVYPEKNHLIIYKYIAIRSPSQSEKKQLRNLGDKENAGTYRNVPVTISGSSFVPPQPYLLSKLMEDYFIIMFAIWKLFNTFGK